MQKAQQVQPNSELDVGNLLNLYRDSLVEWQRSYNSFFCLSNQQQERTSGSTKPHIAFDSAAGQLQNVGEMVFRRFVEGQIELCRFYAKRWEQYLDLPSDLSRCQSAVDLAQLQAAFLTKMAADYGIESRSLAQTFREVLASWMASPTLFTPKEPAHH